MMGFNFKLHLGGSLAVLAFLSACTDSRPRQLSSDPYSTVSTDSTLVAVADVKFQNQSTVALQMKIRGTSLYMTGRPFGFTRWEISPNAENPMKTFAISDNIPTFSPMGSWITDYYASGALEIFGQTAFTSGTFGLSAINLASTNMPVEVARKPPLIPGSGAIPSDEAYVYQAIVQNPSKAVYYGFRQQDYVYTVDTSTTSLNLVRKEAYGANGQNVCCVTSATLFGNQIYVAFRDHVSIFKMASDGRLVPSGSYNELHASNVVSTPRYLYIQHEPLTGVATSRPRGLYVFDAQGNSAGRIDTGVNLLRMAVSWDDAYVYANVDNQSVKIYRIQWNGNLSQ